MLGSVGLATELNVQDAANAAHEDHGHKRWWKCDVRWVVLLLCVGRRCLGIVSGCHRRPIVNNRELHVGSRVIGLFRGTVDVPNLPGDAATM